jgi:fructose-1,6-bisphosphatase/inositol monophosphatase family enzyme
MQIDLEKITRLLEETAAEVVLPRFRTLASHEIQEKELGELVTVADVAAEERLSAALLDLHPGTVAVGEEGVAADPGVMDLLAGDDPVWLIDPIDGTGNFAAGRPIFAIMVALVQGGHTVAAWIHEPMAERTAVAEAGAGAWMAGRRLTVAQAAPLQDMRGTLHASQFATKKMARAIQSRRSRVGAVKTLRCAGAEYLRLVTGETHFSLYTKLMPWDHAPGVLIHGEAGGTARTSDGVVYDSVRRDADALLVAPDEPSWQALQQALFT